MSHPLSLAWITLYALLAFAAGSVPFGVVLARLRGIDLTRVGSGNIGATNAARALGRTAGIVVLVLDAAKGFVPVFVARRYGITAPDLPFEGAGPALVGFAAVLGHVFSPWLGFKGGKGVATSLGVFLAIAPVAAAIALGAWIICYALTRIASVGSLVAALVIVVVMIARHEATGSVIAVIATFVVVVIRHIDNLKRLLSRTESKV